MSSIKRRPTRKAAPATPAPHPVRPSESLLFAAKWSDGLETRMSVYTTVDNLDVARGVAVSRAAYSSRAARISTPNRSDDRAGALRERRRGAAVI